MAVLRPLRDSPISLRFHTRHPCSRHPMRSCHSLREFRFFLNRPTCLLRPAELGMGAGSARSPNMASAFGASFASGKEGFVSKSWNAVLSRRELFGIPLDMGASYRISTPEKKLPRVRGVSFKSTMVRSAFLNSRRSKKSEGDKPSRSGNSSRYKTFIPEDSKHILRYEKLMENCRKQTTRTIISRLSNTNLLGLNENLKGGNLKEGTINAEILMHKREFPHEIVLCRVGEFYETVGYDACLLIEYAGLNPMGGVNSQFVPKAGCPVVNLRQTINDLTSQGFSVSVIEEVQGPSSARERKKRYLAGHAHPGSPYLYGLASTDLDIEFPPQMPIVGLARSFRGYSYIAVSEAMQTFTFEEGLSEEAVVAKLRANGFLRLFLHNSLKDNKSGTVKWGEFGEGGLLYGECMGKQYSWYDSDPILQLISMVKDLFDLDQSTVFRQIDSPTGNRPRPLYLSTATQIGILPSPGVPSLIKSIIEENRGNNLIELYLRNLLLNPPPYAIAKCISECCKFLQSTSIPLPDFLCIQPSKIVMLLRAREASHVELQRVCHLAKDLLYLAKDNNLRKLMSLVLHPTYLSTGIQAEEEQLVIDCQEIVEMIENILDNSDEEKYSQSQSQISALLEMIQDRESTWRGRVKGQHLEGKISRVEETAAALENAIIEDFLPVVELVRCQTGNVGSLKCTGDIFYNRDQGSVWFKGKRFKNLANIDEVPGVKEAKNLVFAIDFNSTKKIGDDWYTTTKVEEALNDYRSASDAARIEVFQILRDLSSSLEKKLNAIITISTLSIIIKALDSHVRECKRKLWSIPTLSNLDSDNSSDTELQLSPIDPYSTNVSSSSLLSLSSTSLFQCHHPSGIPTLTQNDRILNINELIPFWLDPTIEPAVANSFTMHSVFLLTGPNGGGKSSFLRSLCAAALLANCGLMVPAKSATFPNFDSIILRMMSSDSPADGKSAFQIEMSELRSILTETSSRSLVLIDELCKGTEVNKGACIVGASLEFLDSLKCMGAISTHLHSLLDMPLNMNHVVKKAMGATEVNGKIIPTWKLVDGECRESLAFEVARREGVPNFLLQRAQELYKLGIKSNTTKTNAASNENKSDSKAELEERIEPKQEIGKENEHKKLQPHSGKVSPLPSPPSSPPSMLHVKHGTQFSAYSAPQTFIVSTETQEHFTKISDEMVSHESISLTNREIGSNSEIVSSSVKNSTLSDQDSSEEESEGKNEPRKKTAGKRKSPSLTKRKKKSTSDSTIPTLIEGNLDSNVNPEQCKIEEKADIINPSNQSVGMEGTNESQENEEITEELSQPPQQDLIIFYDESNFGDLMDREEVAENYEGEWDDEIETNDKRNIYTEGEIKINATINYNEPYRTSSPKTNNLPVYNTSFSNGFDFDDEFSDHESTFQIINAEENGMRVEHEVFELSNILEMFKSLCVETLPGVTHLPNFTVVLPRHLPPPSSNQTSCVYIMQRVDGKLYVGETDNITNRIRTHRQSANLRNAIIAYIHVPNKSQARLLETNLILRLKHAGFDLVNRADQNHRYFGSMVPPF